MAKSALSGEKKRLLNLAQQYVTQKKADAQEKAGADIQNAHAQATQKVADAHKQAEEYTKDIEALFVPYKTGLSVWQPVDGATISDPKAQTLAAEIVTDQGSKITYWADYSGHAIYQCNNESLQNPTKVHDTANPPRGLCVLKEYDKFFWIEEHTLKLGFMGKTPYYRYQDPPVINPGPLPTWPKWPSGPFQGVSKQIQGTAKSVFPFPRVTGVSHKLPISSFDIMDLGNLGTGKYVKLDYQKTAEKELDFYWISASGVEKAHFSLADFEKKQDAEQKKRDAEHTLRWEAPKIPDTTWLHSKY